MARLQIVTLPTLTVGAVSSPEYLIVIDEVGEQTESFAADLLRMQGKVREMTGTRGVLVFENTIEVV
jgi:hypothetical protein